MKSYSYAGFELTATVDTGKTVVEYPAVASDAEVNAFIALENEKYGLGDLGVIYTLEGNGVATFTYPEEYSKEVVAAELDLLVEDLIAYISTPAPVEEPEVAEPVAEEENVQPTPMLPPVAPMAPVELPEKEYVNEFDFSLLVRGGAAGSFADNFDFDGTVFAELGLGFDFASIFPAGDNFGIGLRSDLVVDFLPKETGMWNLENNLDYFNLLNYAEITSLDLKLMFYVPLQGFELYFGGGVGFAVGNPHDFESITRYLGSGTFDIGTVSFAMDWFASATAGMRFYTGDVFSIGAEINYRYMVGSGRNIGSADIVLGFTF